MCVAPNNARGHYVWWRGDITRNEGPSSDRAKFYRTHNCLCNKTQHQKWNLSQEVFGNLGNGHLIFHRQCPKIWPPYCVIPLKCLHLTNQSIWNSSTLHWAISPRNFVITDNLVTMKVIFYMGNHLTVWSLRRCRLEFRTLSSNHKTNLRALITENMLKSCCRCDTAL